MLKLGPGKILQKPQQKTKRKQVVKRLQKQKRSEFHKPQKLENQKQQQSGRTLLTEEESSSDTDEKEEGFETPYEASEQKEKL